MKHKETLTNLPSIYDSAIDSSIWGETLEASARNIGAKGALLLIIDQSPEGGFQVNHFSHIWSRAPERTSMYNQRFACYEKPVWDKLSTLPMQTLILDTDFWAEEHDLLNRPDYQYLRKTVGICHKCAARLNNNMSWWDTLVIHFDDSLTSIPSNSVSQINTLLPHVAKAVELGRAFDILKKQYQAVLSALDYVEVGLCIALEDGSIIVSNEEARRILEQCDGIRMAKDKVIKCEDRDKNAQLEHAICQISLTASGQALIPEVLFSVGRSPGRSSCLVEVAPLRDYAAELETNLHGALITLVDPENSTPFSIRRVAEVYKFTAAETEVCRLLVDGYSNPEIAEERNVSLETIKSQVNAVMRKTDCIRRSDLIRLALKTSPPIRHS